MTRFYLQLALLAFIFVAGMASIQIWAQAPPALPNPPAATFKPSEIESLRLQVKQKDAQLAQAAMQSAQQAFSNAMKAIQDECERVKTDEKWPSTVQCDMNNLTFVDTKPARPPSPPAPPTGANATAGGKK